MIKSIWRTLLFVSLMAGSGPALASAERGIGAWEEIPTALALKDQNGDEQNFDSLAGEKGLVLVFVRSADWCPYCQVQLIELHGEGEQITALDYNIAVISYDDVDVLKAFADKYDFAYPLLSDEGSQTIRAFGLLNEELGEDSPYYGIPHPAVYVIGRDGVIQARLFEEDYKQRPPVAQIVQVIETMETAR